MFGFNDVDVVVWFCWKYKYGMFKSDNIQSNVPVKADTGAVMVPNKNEGRNMFVVVVFTALANPYDDEFCAVIVPINCDDE
jgi:hypothetical protein